LLEPIAVVRSSLRVPREVDKERGQANQMNVSVSFDLFVTWALWPTMNQLLLGGSGILVV
jgi:hypothetical protein